MNSLSSRRNKYSNYYIFMKREIAFNKSVEKKKAIFKYQNYALFDTKKKPIYQSKKNMVNNRSFSLNLTENMLKANKSMFYFKKNENLNSIELDSKDKNKDYLRYLNHKENTIFNNYNKFGNRRKRLNLKLINEKFLLQTFDTKIQKEKEIEFLSNIEKKNNYSFFQKKEILERSKNKELTKIKYISNIKDYLTFKTNLNIKKEKEKVIIENIKEQIDTIDDKNKNLKKNFNTFNNNFFFVFDKYIKHLSNKIKIEKEKDNQLVEIINTIKQKIIDLKSKINKIKNNSDDINKYVYIFLCIKEKKLELPNYYKIILENKISEKKTEMKIINKKEIENISNYKRNIRELDPELIFSRIKKIENEEIDLIKRYNLLRGEITILNNEKEELNKNISSINNNISDIIIESKNRLLSDLKKKYNKLNNNKKILISYSSKKEEDTDFLITNNKLYNNINKIIYNINNYLKYDFGAPKIILRGDKVNLLILDSLSKLEILVNIIMNLINEFKRRSPNKIYLFQQLIDKNKRIRKTMEQKNKNEMKIKNENKRIKEKNEKLIIIPAHKINNYNMISKNLLRKNNVNKTLKIETIYDYLSE